MIDATAVSRSMFMQFASCWHCCPYLAFECSASVTSLTAAAASPSSPPLQMMADGHTYINIDAQHIKASSPRLLAATVESPEDMLLLWDEAINRLAREQTDLLEEMGLATPEDTLQV